MKELGLFVLPLDGMLVHRRFTPRFLSGYYPTIDWYPLIHMGKERHYENEVSCIRTQHKDPGQDLNRYA